MTRGLEAKLLLGSQRAVSAAVGATEAPGLGPNSSAFAHPEVAAGAGGEAVKGSVEALANTALDAEAPEGDLPVSARLRVAISHQTAVRVDVRMLRLQHVKMLGRANSKADVAFKVPRLVIVTFFARTMLGKILGSSHDKLSFVVRVSHALRVDGLVEITVHGGEVNERLVV